MIPFPKKNTILFMQIQLGLSKHGQARVMLKSPKYDLMTIDDIKNMPVDDIADDNCILFIWVTYPLLKEGLDTIKAWNFEYKTCGFSWVKKNKKESR